MTAGMVLGGILFGMIVILVGVLSKRTQTRRGAATNSDGSVAMYGGSGGGDSGCDSGSGADCGGGGGDGGGGGGGD